MGESRKEPSWSALLEPGLAMPLAVLLGGVLLHSMNVLVTATLLPSIVADLGGVNLMSWPTTAFVASSIVAAAGSAVVSGSVGNRRAFCLGAVVYAAGAALCALSPSIGLVITGRFVQGLGGGLLNALAYVLVRNVFPQGLWPRVLGYSPAFGRFRSLRVLCSAVFSPVMAVGEGPSSRLRPLVACLVLLHCLSCRPMW